MALFGAPVAHEDDPERAVRACLAIRDWALDHEDVQVRIAVTTGEALIRLDARPEAGEGMASGDVVNTAARLQSAAPVNGILADETTYRATRNAIDYEEAPAVEAKGKAEPIAVWEAASARGLASVSTSHTTARTELVGRERELSILRDALRASAARADPAARDARGRARHGQESARLRALSHRRRRSRDHHVAPGSLPCIRGRNHVLGARRGRKGTGRHPRAR